MSLFNIPSCLIFHNTKIKEYPDGAYKITVASKPVFKEKGFELSEDKPKLSKPKNLDGVSRDDSVLRAKNRVYDIIRMNDFSCFVTLTFSGEKTERSSVPQTFEKVTNFLANQVQRSNLKYVLIPEYHKKNKAIHLHGFFCGNIKLLDSGTVKAEGYDKPIKKETARRKGIDLEKCQAVYNLPQWKWGFSTAIKTNGNNAALSKYITKYITKDVQKIFGNFYLAGGKGLIRDVPFSLSDTDFSQFQGDSEVYCPVTDTSFKYLDTSGKSEKYAF